MATATATSPQIFFDERPRDGRRASLEPTPHGSEPDRPVPARVNHDATLAVALGGEIRLQLPPAAPLTEVAARIEGAAAGVVALYDGDLAPVLKARTPLAVLQRRAIKRGKHLILVTPSQDLRHLAAAAGLQTAMPPAAASHQSREDAEQLPEAQAPKAGVTRSVLSPSSPARALRPRAVSTAVPVVCAVPRGATLPAASREALGQLPGAPASRQPPATRTVAQGSVPTSAHVATATATAVSRASLPLGAAPVRAFWAAAAGQTGLSGRRPARASAVTMAASLVAGRRFLTPALLVGAALALSLFLAWLIVPAASVRVTPVSEVWTVDMPVTVDPGIKKPDVAQAKFPGRVISKEIADSTQLPATGRKIVPDGRAVAEAVFINKSTRPVAVPKGTLVLAGTARFITQADVTVAPTTGSGLQQRYGMQRVQVLAAAAGPSGNVDRFQINRIEGPLADTLDVQNDAPARGGTERPMAYVTADDRKKLHDTLYRTLSERLTQQLRAQLPTGPKESVLPWSGQNPAIVEATYSKNVDEEASTISLTLKLRYGVTIFHNDNYNAFVHQLAVARLGQQRPDYQITGGPLEAQPPDVLGIDNGTARLSARASGTITAKVDQRQVRAELANRSLTEAHARLRDFEGIAAYELQSSPGWYGRTPWLGSRIAVDVSAE